MKVIKRNKNIEEFDIEKIFKAIRKAYSSSQEKYFPKSKVFPNPLIRTIRTDYENEMGLIAPILWKEEVTVEEIQDIVEQYLKKEAPYKVMKEYILYREQHKASREIKERLDYMKYYIESEDNASSSSETDPNANVTIKNVANLEGEVYKTTNRIIQRQRMKDKLNELYPEVAKQYEEDLNHHIIYAHDESCSPSLKNYCMAATLYPLMLEGTGNIDGVTPSAPNDIQSFSGQVTNLVFLLSSQVRGAVALGDYIIALNYYVIKEFGNNWYKNLYLVTTKNCLNNRTIKDTIRKGMKQFIYGINQPAGNRSYNSPFSNLNFFDKYYYEALFKEFYYPDGTKPEWEAIDCLQRIFVELLRELRLIKPLTFPVTSVCMLHDNEKCLDDDCRQWIADEWAKGSSFFLYLSNNPNSISSCCRVQNEITDNTFNSTIGLTGIMTGSTNVITLNLNRIVQDCYKNNFVSVKEAIKEDKNNDFAALKAYLIFILERVYKYQIAYKTLAYEMEDKGMYSSSNAKYIYTKKLYCTIGVIGYCEAALYLEYDITDNKDYKHFLQVLFKTIQEENKKHSIYDKKRPFIFNTEAIPGENLAVKFYNWDKKDGYVVPEDQVLYSSYFFRQWDKNLSVLDKLRLHNRDINKYCGGGQACHVHLNEHLSKEQYLKLIDFAVHEGCNYFTFNIPMSECKDCGHVVNAPIQECPKCKSKNIDWWVRIIGYLRPISAFSNPRQIEQKTRVYHNKVENE